MTIVFTGSSTTGFTATAGNTFVTRVDETISNSGNGFNFSTFNNGEYLLFGHVIATVDGIIDAATTNQKTVVVHEGASVFAGFVGIELNGNDTVVTNNGTVIGQSSGILTFGDDNVLTNNGFQYLGDAEAFSVARGATVPTWTYLRKYR